MQGDCSFLAVAAMSCATKAAEKFSNEPERHQFRGAEIPSNTL